MHDFKNMFDVLTSTQFLSSAVQCCYNLRRNLNAPKQDRNDDEDVSVIDSRLFSLYRDARPAWSGRQKTTA